MTEILKKEKFDDFFKLMEESFPVDEYRNYENQKSLFDIPEYKVYSLFCDDKVLKAFIALWQFEDFVFIEHFAVNQKYRNCGVGSEFLQEIVNKFDLPVCLEVELPDTDIAKRRIGFYERNNFSLNHYDYTQPAMGKEKKTIPLLIMTTRGKIDKEQFAKIKSTLYKKVYNCN